MKYLGNLLLTAITLALLWSCDSNTSCDCDNIPNLRPISAAEDVIIESINDFSFDIFARINDTHQNENLFISPLSISTALSMTANGAVAETKVGIKQTLHMPDVSDEEVNMAYRDLAKFITELDSKVTMQLANSNWYKQDYHIEPDFRNVLLDFYDAEVLPADFANPATKDLINGWIEDKTNGKIKDMIDQIPSNVVMYLINAIYLKATWQYQFDKEQTEKRDFTLIDGASIQTDMMYSEGVTANYFADEQLQLIELPYGNGQFVFSVLLPHQSSQLEQLIQDLDMQSYNSYIESADTSTFKVYLPKFKIEYKTLLNEVLSAMGMELSFSGEANFSDLFVEELDLYISRVLHQSFLEVDEEGTEAAAATVVEIRETSAGPGAQPDVLRMDKPFAFFIREKHSNTILFSGKLMDPSR